jgi:two-component system sensor histidine kinase TtrS
MSLILTPSLDWQATISINYLFCEQQFKLTVEDNGIGLSLESAQVIQPFVSTKQEGLGLGLVICQDVMDDHNGRIALQPITPHGCQVTLVLPKSEGESRG